MMTLDDYQQMRQTMREKEKNLATAIQEDSDQLDTMQQSYKQALASDEEQQADELFPQIEDVKKRLASNRQKQSTLKEVNAERVRTGAKEAAAEVFALKKEAQGQAGKVLAEVNELLTTLDHQTERLKQISQTYEEQRHDRRDVVDAFDMGVTDLGQALHTELTRDGISNPIAPWRGLLAYRNDMQTMIQRYVQAQDREARKQERKNQRKGANQA